MGEQSEYENIRKNIRKEDDADPEVEAHSLREASDEPEDSSDEPDVEGHSLRKNIRK
jgi:hypothetical protein